MPGHGTLTPRDLQPAWRGVHGHLIPFAALPRLVACGWRSAEAMSHMRSGHPIC